MADPVSPRPAKALVFRGDCRGQFASPAKAGMVLAPLARILVAKLLKI